MVWFLQSVVHFLLFFSPTTYDAQRNEKTPKQFCLMTSFRYTALFFRKHSSHQKSFFWSPFPSIPTGDSLILLWISNRCLKEELSSSSGLHKGSAVVPPVPSRALTAWLILAGGYSPRLPSSGQPVPSAAPVWLTSATHNVNLATKENRGVRPRCPPSLLFTTCFVPLFYRDVVYGGG